MNMIYKQIFHFMIIIDCSFGIVLHKSKCQPKKIFTRSTNTEEDVTKCFEEPKLWCNKDSKYRTIDGRCNNLDTRSWGMANTAMFRITKANYKDSMCSIREVNGKPLPSAVKLARLITTPKRATLSENISVFFIIFAQLIAEDVTSLIIKPSDKKLCCSGTNSQSYGELNCACMSSTIFQNPGNCTQSARSKTTLHIECPMFPVHQLNSVSSFLDLSFLYSSNVDTINILRFSVGGKMKVTVDIEDRPFAEILQNFERPDVHKNIAMSVLQSMLVRLHNFLCELLNWLNPTWEDERLFQEARKIAIAMYQHVVYYEFLPIVVGYEYAKRYDLMPKITKLNEFYDPDVNPSTVNSFATAAFRYFHQLIPGNMKLLSSQYKPYPNKNFTYSERDINMTEANNFDGIIRGFLAQSISSLDRMKLEKRILLLATDIERTRDHGLTTYNDFREACGLPRIFDFKDLKKIIKPEDVSTLAGIYDDVDDIELYVGGSLEIPTRDAVTGPTFQCLIAETFYRYKFGDRFYYEHKDVVGQFSKEQLQEIKKVTGSLLVCIASDMILKVQTNIFYLPSIANPFVPCELILRPDFSKWQESQETNKNFFTYQATNKRN